jgi:filamentous hemagglutinin family protein
MNLIFRTVWNAQAQVWQAASEITRGRSKSSSSSAKSVLLGSLILTSVGAWAQLPSGGQVSVGSGSISTDGQAMTITQNSAKLSVNWRSFSLGQGHSVNFVQPSSSAVALNRVVGSDVSTIQGSINANGRVFLVNPNGILFTPTAQVNVGGIVASTLNISDADFMADQLRFEGSSSNAIVNQGNIRAADGGTVALIAASITNDGSLTANGGNVLLGAGNKVTLDLGGPVKLLVENDELETLIDNGGAIKADGGTVLLTSQAAANLASSVINNSGRIEANRLNTNQNGEVVLFAHGGSMNLAGTVSAEGGFVETSGKFFEVQDGARVNAANWLIDPVNIDIDASMAASIQTALASGNVTVTTDGDCTGVTCSGAGSDGDITVNSAIAWSSNQTLTLSAYRNIVANNDITHTGATGGVIFLYGQGSATGASSSYSGSGAVVSPSIQWKRGSAVNSMRYAVVGGNYFLGNEYIEVGVCGPGTTNCSGSAGKFGTTNKPSLFFGRSSGSGIGMVGDADGFGSGADLRIDYFLPGSPAEQFSAIFNGTTTATNFAAGGSFAFAPLGADGKITLTYDATLLSKLKITQVVTLNPTELFFNNNVTLKNLDSSDLTDVFFSRSFDPDNTVDVGGNYSTIQKIEQTLTAGDAANVVSASSTEGDAYSTLASGNSAKIIYYSTNPNTSVGYGSNFFSGSDLPSMVATASGQVKDNTASGDVGIGIVFNAQTLTPGQTKSFSYLTSLDNRDITTILTSLSDAASATPTTPTTPTTPVVQTPVVLPDTTLVVPTVVTTPDALKQAVQNAVQQPVVSNNNPVINNPANTTPDVSNAGKPPVNVVLPQEGTLPVVDLSSGLAFVELSAPNGQSGSESGNGSSGGGDLAPPAGVTGMDPLGFMRVFVTRGGINMPEQASNDVGAENTRRKEELAN